MENSKIPSDELVSDIKDAINYLSGSLKYPELLDAVDELHSRLKKLEHSARAQPVAVPDGYVLVPVEPTQGMFNCLVELTLASGDLGEACRRGYRAMLSAAQKPAGKDCE